jgi:hypothetical protein
MEVDVPHHAGRLHDPAQLHFAPLSARAVRPERRFKRVRGPHQLLVGESGLLQLLGQLTVLFQPVPFQQGYLLLHRRQLLSHWRQGPQDAGVLLTRRAQLPVLGGQELPFGVRGSKLGAHLRKAGRNAVEIRLQGGAPAAQHHVHRARAGHGAQQQH